MKAILTVGVSGCGKSFWANEQKGFTVLSRDDFRKEELLSLGIDVSEINLWKHFNFKKHEKNSHERWRVALDNAVEDKKDLILADTWLNENLRNQIIAELEAVGYEVELKVFFTDYYTCLKQNRLRKDSLEDSVITEQWKKFAEQFLEKYIPNLDLPSAIVCDIDGCASLMTNRRPYEWDKVDTDIKNDVVFTIISGLVASTNNKIIFVSGRDSVCFNKTKQWLSDNGYPSDLLFMRKEGDMRPDNIVKREIFFDNIAPFFNVQFVIDDRPKVIRMWMDLGLKTVIIGNPWIEF